MSREEQLPDQPSEEHFQIPMKANTHLGLMLDGNGIRAEQVRLARYDTQVHVLHGEMNIVFKPDMTSKQVKGKRPTGLSLDNQNMAMAQAVSDGQLLSADELAHKEIIDLLGTKPGVGFGIDPFRFKLTCAHKEYSVIDKCLKCNGATTNPCGTCNASGNAPCTGCVGQGFTPCPICYGAGQQQKPDGSRVPCVKCTGTGRTPCMTCQGQKFLRCAVCNGQGRTNCTECDKSGFWTHIYDAHWHGEATFVLDRTKHAPEILEVVDLIGLKNLAPEEHVEVFRLIPEVLDGHLIIPYAALLPIAQAEFSILGKMHPSVVAGLHGRFVEIEPILDTMIKPGIASLLKLSKGPLAVAPLMETACRFKAVRQVLAGLAHHSKGHVYKKMLKEYPLLISDKYAKAAVNYAEKAILALSDGPRWRGFAMGVVAAGGLYALHYMTGMRGAVSEFLASKKMLQHLVLVDVIIWSLGYAAAVLAIKFTASAALKKLLPATVQTKETGLPPAGQQGIYAVPTTLVFWLAAAFFAVARPEWLAVILQKIGVG